MLKLESQIKDFKLPLLIPKRNKGHNEVLSHITVKINGSHDPEDLIQAILSISSKVVSPTLFYDLMQQIFDDFQISNISFNTSFHYHLDRTSPKYHPSTFELLCSYRAEVKNNIIRFYMGIDLPVRIKGVFPLQGNLAFYIEEPHNVFFEDLLDHVQKYAGMKLYPIITSKEQTDLRSIIDTGKAPKEYLDILMNTSSIKELGKGGYVKISAPDIYSIYKVSYSVIWANEYVKYILKKNKTDKNWETEFIERLSKELIKEMCLSDAFYIDVFFNINKVIAWWKERTGTIDSTIREHGSLVYMMIKKESKERIEKELETWYHKKVM
jgi:hypothetical protein